MSNFDIVTCVALKDCKILEKNIAFIQRYLSPKNIYIITDPRNFRHFTADKNVVLIDENNLIPGLSLSTVKNVIDSHLNAKPYGWYFQQFLKMAFALSSYAKNKYLIWDADTFPLVGLSFIEDEKYIFTVKTERHKPYFSTMEKLLGYGKIIEDSFIAEHMLIDVEIMKELISQLENSALAKNIKGENWFEKCIYSIEPTEVLGFSEFETYGTFCLKNYPSRISTRKLRTYRGGSKIFSIYVKDSELDSLSCDFDTVSFEVGQFPLASLRMYRQKLHYYYCKVITKLRIL